MPKKLTKKTLSTILRTLAPHWTVDVSGTHLIAMIKNPTYLQGFMLVTKIAIHAEVQHHYPTITLTESTVEISLTTAVVNGITDRDITLAKQIDQLLLSTKK